MFGSDGLCSLRWNPERSWVEVIDQTLLPHQLQWIALESLGDYCHAISAMQVRGAPLIGITAAFGLASAVAQSPSDDSVKLAYDTLLATRPTAVNLRWGLDQVVTAIAAVAAPQRAEVALQRALELREQDIASCNQIGDNGLALLEPMAADKTTLNIMTHCNAGWLATIQWGTALAPIYKAHEKGLPVHVWVSETRPRNQGMHLTTWELHSAGVPYTLVADNSCGQLMREGLVDAVIVGSDRTAANGDVCNKIGTYLKALAAQANNIPFFAALPCSTIDWHCSTGDDIPIEERAASEVLAVAGMDTDGAVREVQLTPSDTVAHNPAFDVTPADLVSALITEHGSYPANSQGLQSLRALLDEAAART